MPMMFSLFKNVRNVPAVVGAAADTPLQEQRLRLLCYYAMLPCRLSDIDFRRYAIFSCRRRYCQKRCHG